MERRERIARMRAEGLRNKEIAAIEGISTSGVWHYTKDMPKVIKWNHARAHNNGMRLGGWRHVTIDALALVAKEIRGDETIIACLSRIAVAWCKQNKKEERHD